MGEFKKAINDFNAILTEKPEDVETHLQRASVYTAAQDFKAALADIDYAIRQKFEDQYMYLNLAYIFYRTSELTKAYGANEKAIAFNNDETLKSDLYFQKGLLLLSMGRTDEAQVAYDKGRAYAEGASNFDSINDGIDDLKEVKDSNKSISDVVRKVISRLEESRKKTSPQAKPSKNRCHKLRV